MTTAKEVTGKVKVGTGGILESFGMAAYKVGSEAALSRFIGDATYKSGLIKLALGVGAGFLIPAGKIGSPARRIISSAHIIDGMEDLVYATGLASKLSGGAVNPTQNAQNNNRALSGVNASGTPLLAVV